MLILTSTPADLRKSRRYLKQPFPEHLASAATGLRGVAYRDGHLLFDRQLHSEDAAQVLIAHLKGTHLKARFQGIGSRVEVTDEDLAIINERHSPERLTRETVEVFEEYAANIERMRKPFRFTRRALDALAAEAIRGRTTILHHDEQRPVGRTFAAEVWEGSVRGLASTWMRLRWYAPLAVMSEQRRQDLADIRTGVLTYSSMLFSGGTWTSQSVEVDEEHTEYFFEVDADPEGAALEMFEFSKVMIGAQYETGNNKLTAAGDGAPDPAPPPPASTTRGKTLWIKFD